MTDGGAGLAPGKFLKEHTAAAHSATERLLLGDDGALRAGRLRLERYERLITTTAAVWAAARAAFADVPYYPKYQAIIDDLATAAEKDEALLPANLALATSPNFPEITDKTTALGSLYVLLGSTLGGKMIARTLDKSPELQPLPHYYFYEACAAVPPKTWPGFQRELAAVVTSKGDLERCGEQALATFALYQFAYPTSG